MIAFGVTFRRSKKKPWEGGIAISVSEIEYPVDYVIDKSGKRVRRVSDYKVSETRMDFVRAPE